jgi:hypothetical protein
VARFKWIEWNLDKIAAHGLSYEDVEYAYDHASGAHQEREDGSYETIGTTPSGKRILIVWRYDQEFDAVEKGNVIEVVFVITAY